MRFRGHAGLYQIYVYNSRKVYILHDNKCKYSIPVQIFEVLSQNYVFTF